MQISTKQLFDSLERKVWSLHEGREHLGFLELAAKGWTARRVDGKRLKTSVPTKEIATAWLLAKRLGIEDESRAKGRALVRIRTVQRQQAGSDRQHQEGGVATATGIA